MIKKLQSNIIKIYFWLFIILTVGMMLLFIYHLLTETSNSINIISDTYVFVSTSSALLPLIGSKFKSKNKAYILLVFISLILVSSVLQYLGVKSINHVISIYKLGLFFNIIILFFMSYNTLVILLIINSPHQFESSRIFKYIPNFLQNQYLHFNDIKNILIYKYYIRLFSSGIFIAIFILIVLNVLLFYIS